MVMMDTVLAQTTSLLIVPVLSSDSDTLQSFKFLQNPLGGIPQLPRQILPPRILAGIFEDTIWYQILPFVLVTFFKDLARGRSPCGRISPVVWGDKEE